MKNKKFGSVTDYGRIRLKKYFPNHETIVVGHPFREEILKARWTEQQRWQENPFSIFLRPLRSLRLNFRFRIFHILCELCTTIRNSFLRLRKLLGGQSRELFRAGLARGQKRRDDPSAFFRYNVTMGL